MNEREEIEKMWIDSVEKPEPHARDAACPGWSKASWWCRNLHDDAMHAFSEKDGKGMIAVLRRIIDGPSLSAGEHMAILHKLALDPEHGEKWINLMERSSQEWREERDCMMRLHKFPSQRKAWASFAAGDSSSGGASDCPPDASESPPRAGYSEPVGPEKG